MGLKLENNNSTYTKSGSTMMRMILMCIGIHKF